MIVFPTTATNWIVEVPTGDPEMPWIQMGSMFTSQEQAQRNLRGWRQELQEVARIRQYTYESFTAHEA